jgi:hypothetical protein
LSRKGSGAYSEKQQDYLFSNDVFRTTLIPWRVKIKPHRRKNIECRYGSGVSAVKQRAKYKKPPVKPAAKYYRREPTVKAESEDKWALKSALL